MKTLTIGFIGLGLIGGSIAKALRSSLPDTIIIAYDKDPATLALTLEEGVANQVTSQIDASFSGCDYIFLCAPVSSNGENLAALLPFLSPSCILTDVGSVKGCIHRQADSLGLSSRFIGGHPMAGSERFGYPNSKARLLENAYYILTPSRDVPQEHIDAYRSLVTSMKCIPLVLEPQQHDYVTAAISHLPHLIAFSLVNLVKDHDSEEETMKMIAAGGFKDITRIASSSPQMWQQICLTNQDNILRLLNAYIDSLQRLSDTLIAQDGQRLWHFFDTARSYRDSFIEASSGPIKKSYSLRVDIADETGALASIATILALHQISIKNIGIVHNREREEGALRIEFYEETAIQKASHILTSRGYHIY